MTVMLIDPSMSTHSPTFRLKTNMEPLLGRIQESQSMRTDRSPADPMTVSMTLERGESPCIAIAGVS
jgi:hypothetical protein